MDNRGQGALEYLLLIGGAVLIATIVLLIIIQSSDTAEGVINQNINEFSKHININA
jgi:uncharacterized protein (UPF0333 family)